MLRNFCVIFVLTLNILNGWPQPNHSFTAYSEKEGLQTKNVMDILQDHRGKMWFATWDGLYLFDGYKFHNYKSVPGDGSRLRNNRFDKVMADSLGAIWVKGYGGEVYRFNQSYGNFEELPLRNYQTTGFYPIKGGRVWITTNDSRLLKIDSKSINTHRHTAIAFMGKGNLVNNICEDIQGNEWILSEKGLFLYTQGKLKRIMKGRFLTSTKLDSITYFTSNRGRVYAYNGNHFWRIRLMTTCAVTHATPCGKHSVAFGTAGDGIYRYSPFSKNRVQHFRLPGNNVVISLFSDWTGNIWVDSKKSSVMLLKAGENSFCHLPLYDKYGQELNFIAPSQIIEDKNKQIWVSPGFGGLAWFDREHSKLVPFYDGETSYWSNETNLACVYNDRQGNLWFCPNNIGLRKVTFNNNIFRVLKTGKNDYDLNVRGLIQDRNGVLWVGSKSGLVFLYNDSFQLKGCLDLNGNVGVKGSKFGRIYCFCEDHEGNMWIGTKGNGLFRAKRKFGNQFQISHFKTGVGCFDLTNNNIFSLCEDSLHRLWIATYGGGINLLDLNHYSNDRLNQISAHFISYRNFLKNYPQQSCDRVRHVACDFRGNVWISTTQGLIRADGKQRNIQHFRFKLFTKDSNDISSLSYNDVHMVYTSKEGVLYICTNGGGFNRSLGYIKNQLHLKTFTQKDGLGSDIVFSAIEDEKGNIWFCSEESISKYNPHTNQIQTYTSENIGQNISIDHGQPIRTQRGYFMFPTYNSGIICFNPLQIKVDSFVPSIMFTDFLQEMISVKPNVDGILKTNIDDTRHIVLQNNRNSFSIEFAALDMKAAEKIEYAYRLLGFEEKWNYSGPLRIATYTNLSKGDYIFQVRSTNSERVWVNNMRAISIRVLPIFWETKWAYLLYILALVGIIAFFTYVLSTFYRLQQKVKMERELSDIKSNFFTQVSHELRTPLTLIYGYMKEIMKDSSLKGSLRSQLQIVSNNSYRMLQLTNQILDIKKIKNEKMEMNISKLNLITFVQEEMKHFENIAREHHIDFKLITEPNNIFVWADAEKLDKIIFNLLSNAFKYTPLGKSITVHIKADDQITKIIVSDQGVGISEDQQKTIFDEYNNNNDHNLYNIPSTGLGLSIVKQLVLLHGGSVEVESIVGKGSTFTVFLPSGRDETSLSAQILPKEKVISTISPNDTFKKQDETIVLCKQNLEQKTLLIVEDNYDMRKLLNTFLSDEYILVEAENGLQGLDQAHKVVPDIIISDIMMPIMDGYEMLRKLHENIITSHIPIILLTALGDDQSKMEGLKDGADSFIVKPFNSDLLKARVENLLDQRSRLQTFYQRQFLSFHKIDDSTADINNLNKKLSDNLSSLDNLFLQKVNDSIRNNISNGSYSVEDLASAVCISQSSCFKKLKALTGLSPNEYLKAIRMQRAAELIINEDCLLAEIASEVGINDSHYFSSCFKKQYGITPTEFRRLNRKEQ